MVCERCGGEVEWIGPLTRLGENGTQCKRCGGRNCQIVEPEPDDDDAEAAESEGDSK